MPAVLSREHFDARLTPSVYNNLLYTAAKRVGLDQAEEVVQDTLLSAWHKVADFLPHQGQDAFAAWLHGHLHFTVLRCIAQEAKKSETTLPPETLFDLCEGPDTPHWEADAWNWQRQELYRRLFTFPLTPHQRACCLHWIQGGLTLRDVGAILDPPCSGTAVWKTIQRVGQLLREADDADPCPVETLELMANLPAALTYEGQLARDNRIRRQADQYAALQNQQREGSRHTPRGTAEPQQSPKPQGNRKARRAAAQREAA